MALVLYQRMRIQQVPMHGLCPSEGLSFLESRMVPILPESSLYDVNGSYCPNCAKALRRGQGREMINLQARGMRQPVYRAGDRSVSLSKSPRSTPCQSRTGESGTASSLYSVLTHSKRKRKELWLSGFKACALCAAPETSGSTPERSEPEWEACQEMEDEVMKQSFHDNLILTYLPCGLSLYPVPNRFTLPQTYFLYPKYPTVYQFLHFGLSLNN